MNNTQLWAVKGFQWIEDKEAMLKYKESAKVWLRQYVLIFKDLTWKKAKEIRKQYSKIEAMITKNQPEDKLKVITLD